jgi:hypothetical protein
MRTWRALYGDRLMIQVLGQVRSPNQRKSALRSTAVLLRRDPVSFVRYLAETRRGGR